MIAENTYVEIETVELEIEDRAYHLPEDTKATPLKAWCRGYTVESSALGEIGKIKTITGRVLQGKIVKINPSYDIDYGNYIPELQGIISKAKELLGGEQ